MPHTHVIDGKLITMDDNTCAICHPEQQQQRQPVQDEQLPRAYRKDNTVVLKITKGRMATLNYWIEGNCYLFTVQHIVTDAKGKAQLDKDGKAIWTKDTLRVPAPVLKDFLNLVSVLYGEIANKGVVPKRD
jgi:hypothetical protein